MNLSQRRRKLYVFLLLLPSFALLVLLLTVCHCFCVQIFLKEETPPFPHCSGFAHLPHSSFLPKNESPSIKKICHLFQSSSFTDIILSQSHCKNLRQHFYSIPPLNSNTFITFLRSYSSFQTGMTFSQMLV